MLLRGVTLLVRCGNKPDAPPAVRALLAPTRWRHGDTGLMCLCTSQARPARSGLLVQPVTGTEVCVQHREFWWRPQGQNLPS